ncbi:MAG TPA: hypothetical protein VFO16_24100 [Pseudonocardiaceae bacterium]|nr:hypothetical protein [Pseudonocardiaceae bacterium]
MAVTDIDQLVDLAWRLVETDQSFTSGLWTLEEIRHTYTDRLNRFNRDTKVMLTRVRIPATANQQLYALPADWLATLRAAWIDTPTNRSSPLTRSDRWAAERGFPASVTPTRPILIDDHSAPGTLNCELFPAPITDGILALLYASTFTPLAFDDDAPDALGIPDEFVPFVTYGVMADLLSKDGRGQNLALAAYCEQRYLDGVRIAGWLLEGLLG